MGKNPNRILWLPYSRSLWVGRQPYWPSRSRFDRVSSLECGSTNADPPPVEEHSFCGHVRSPQTAIKLCGLFPLYRMNKSSHVNGISLPATSPDASPAKSQVKCLPNTKTAATKTAAKSGRSSDDKTGGAHVGRFLHRNQMRTRNMTSSQAEIARCKRSRLSISGKAFSTVHIILESRKIVSTVGAIERINMFLGLRSNFMRWKCRTTCAAFRRQKGAHRMELLAFFFAETSIESKVSGPRSTLGACQNEGSTLCLFT